MISLPIGAAAVLFVRFGLDVMPWHRDMRLRDWGPGFLQLALAALVFAGLTLASIVMERVAKNEGVVRIAIASRFVSLGATLASVAVVMLWIFLLAGLLLCDAGPDC